MATLSLKDRFFNLTAGLEKWIIGILGAVAIWIPETDYFSEPTENLIVAIIIATQMLYAANTEPVPPGSPSDGVDSGEGDRVESPK